MALDLTPAALDRFAEDYYLNDAIDDTDIEELAQRHSIPPILAATAGCPRLLEMGYGTGLIAGELLAADRAVDVLEGSSKLCEFATQRHSGQPLRMIESMFEDFSPTEPYDAVLALHVLEHVDDPVGIVRQIGTWLRHGGVLVAVTPNARSLHRLLGVQLGVQEHLDDLSERDKLVGHQRVYDLAGLSGDLSAGGFEILDTFGYFVKPLSNRQMIDWTPEVLDGLNAISSQVPADICGNIGVVCRRH
ncbi:MAG TPA: hypothetical protein DEG43_00080 [Acidimicrobiaceae bacterium]|jgi:2-polyprenyl-3-methyl-5-hydroxy-6-metoxy-1,4-benzoquinol methylase|nr:hypothetical protein [Acidimicrobiaceae bacterium]